MESQKWDRLPSGMEYRYTTENGKEVLEVKNQTWVAPRWTKAENRPRFRTEFERRVGIAKWRKDARAEGVTF